MDFDLNGQQQLFRKTVHEWVDHEVPKSWARELEKYEHNFPHALLGKFGFMIISGDCAASVTAEHRRSRHGRIDVHRSLDHK